MAKKRNEGKRLGLILLLFLSVAVLALAYPFFKSRPLVTHAHANHGVFSASITQNGNLSLVASVDEGALLWDNINHAQLGQFSFNKNEPTDFVAVSLNRDGTLALAASKGQMGIWDTKTQENLGYWRIGGDVYDAKLSPNGRIAAVAYHVYLNSRNREINQATFDQMSPEGQQEIISQLFYISLYDLKTKRLISKLYHEQPVTAMTLSSDGRKVITGSDDGYVYVWDIYSGKPKQTFKHKKRISQVVLSPDDTLLFTSSAQSVSKVWQLSSGEQITNLKLNSYIFNSWLTVSTAVFTNDNRFLVATSPPRYLRIWDLSTGEIVEQSILPTRTVITPSAVIGYAIALSKAQDKIFIEASNGMSYQYELPIPYRPITKP